MWVITLLMAIVEFILALRAFREWRFHDILDGEGKQIDAVVTTSEKKADRNFGYSYYIAYKFELEGQLYQNRQQVSQQHWITVDIGDPIIVAYLPQNPQSSKLSGKYIDFTQRNRFAFYAAICGLAFVVWLFSIR